MFNLTDTMRALGSLQRAIDGAYRSDWFGPRTASIGSSPPINVFQKSNDLVVLAEVPGARREDFDIQVKGDRLRLAGRRGVEQPEGASVHRMERRAMRFDRTLTLPYEVDADAIKAEYRDGILAVLLPRAASERPRSIQVN